FISLTVCKSMAIITRAALSPIPRNTECARSKFSSGISRKYDVFFVTHSSSVGIDCSAECADLLMKYNASNTPVVKYAWKHSKI
ncbi:hypothetical protein PMAYCL1PPCAC_21480, partial [Pristionchus mayeri]